MAKIAEGKTSGAALRKLRKQQRAEQEAAVMASAKEKKPAQETSAANADEGEDQEQTGENDARKCNVFVKVRHALTLLQCVRQRE